MALARVLIHRSRVEAMARAPFMGKAMAEVADKLASAANGSATVSDMAPPRPFTGGPGAPGEGKMSTSDSGWHLIEYGTATSPAYAAIRGVINDAGLRFEDTGA